MPDQSLEWDKTGKWLEWSSLGKWSLQCRAQQSHLGCTLSSGSCKITRFIHIHKVSLLKRWIGVKIFDLGWIRSIFCCSGQAGSAIFGLGLIGKFFLKISKFSIFFLSGKKNLIGSGPKVPRSKGTMSICVMTFRLIPNLTQHGMFCLTHKTMYSLGFLESKASHVRVQMLSKPWPLLCFYCIYTSVLPSIQFI